VYFEFFVGLYLSWFFFNGIFHEPIMAVGNINELDSGCLCWEEGGVASLAMPMTLIMS
jgi:hypothetical protein